MKKYILLILISLIGSGCAGIIRENMTDNISLKENEGIFVSNIVSNVTGVQVSIINDANMAVVSGLFDLTAGDNLIVVVLPEGNYSWSGISLNRAISDFRGKMPFKIEKNKVNYVGDLEIDISSRGGSYRSKFINREDKVKQQVIGKFPNISKKYNFLTNMTKAIK